MKQVIDYLHYALKRMDFLTDAELARAIEVSPSTIYQWRHDKSLPSQKMVLRFADLAGISPEQALLELSYWRAERDKNEAQRKVYKGLIDKVSGVLTVLIIVFASLISLIGNAYADGGTHPTIEYVNIHYHTIKKILVMVKRLFFNPFRLSFGGVR